MEGRLVSLVLFKLVECNTCVGLTLLGILLHNLSCVLSPADLSHISFLFPVLQLFTSPIMTSSMLFHKTIYIQYMF